VAARRSSKNALFCQSAVVAPTAIFASESEVARYPDKGWKIRYQLKRMNGIIANSLLVAVAGVERVERV
jgi:hypothetical protein